MCEGVLGHGRPAQSTVPEPRISCEAVKAGRMGALGLARFQVRGGGGGGGGGGYRPLARRPPPEKGTIDGPPKILPRLTPGPGGDPVPKVDKK